MEQTIIKLHIVNEHITGSGVSVGAVGSHDEVLLEMDFRSGALWQGTTRRAIFANALGENRTVIILTTNLLEQGQGEVYLVPVPWQAKEVAGECFLTVEGFVTDSSGKEIVRCVTEEARFRVLPSRLYTNDNAPVTPSQAEQLQKEVDSIKQTIVNAGISERNAKASELAAAASAAAANASKEAAGKSQTAAAASAAAAAASAAAAEASNKAAKAAQTGAETAQTAAEAARTGAETARRGAEESAAAAHSSQQAASGSEHSAAQSSQSAAKSAQEASAQAAQADTAAETATSSAQLAEACKDAAAASEASAKAEADRAKAEADRAGAIVGGDFATNQSVVQSITAHDGSPTAHGDIRNSQKAAEDRLSAHTNDEGNPHTVTAAQVGAAPATHAGQHGSGGTDPITPGAIGAAPAGHTHDDRYYTESEVSNLLAGKQDAATAINTGNIGAQTVNYANGANYANSATTARDPNPGAATLKNIYAGTADIGAGAGLATGTIYLCYE